MKQKKTAILHEIDASGVAPGRLATQIASLLRGKHKPTFVPYKDDGDTVVVKNVEGMAIPKTKMEGKTYKRHTGYPGGLKTVTLKELIEKKGYDEVLKRAVWGCLPKNTLRKEMIKRLQFK